MARKAQILARTLIVMAGLLLFQPAWAESLPPPQFTNEGDLRTAINKLGGRGEEKYGALFKLIDYAAMDLFRTPSIFYLYDHPDWIKLATDAVNKLSSDEATLAYCLDHGTDVSKQWAIARSAGKKNLAAHLTNLALTESNGIIRRQALEQLAPDQYAKVKHALKSRRQIDLSLLEKLFPNEADFNEKLAENLRDTDRQLAVQSLTFIGFDGKGGIMPSLNHSFNAAVFNEIVKLANAPDLEERKTAAYALERMKFYDPALVRETFLRLSRDQEPDIRWRAAYGLVEQRGEPGVNQMYDTLMQDPSPLVRYMTIASLPEKDKYAKQLQELAPQAFPTADRSPIQPVVSASTAAWLSKVAPPRQFLLPIRARKLETKRSLEEVIEDRCRTIRAYIKELHEANHESEAQDIAKQLDTCLAEDGNAPLSCTGKEAIFVVSAFSDDGQGGALELPPRERIVHLSNTGARVTLVLMNANGGGSKWQVILDDGAQLKKIMLCGYGKQSTVKGSYPESVQIVSSEADGRPICFCLSQGMESQGERARISAFFARHGGIQPTTVQCHNDSFKQNPHLLAQIRVGPGDDQWRQSLRLHDLEPLFTRAKAIMNRKFQENCKIEFPILFGLPAFTDSNGPLYYNPGWCSQMQGRLVHKITAPASWPFVACNCIAFNPETGVYYLTKNHEQIVSIDSQGREKTISNPDLLSLLQASSIDGLAFDKKRNRLLVSGNCNVVACPLDTMTWAKLPWQLSGMLSCYSQGDDCVYESSGDYVVRVAATDGRTLQEGRLPFPHNYPILQMWVEGNYLIAISPMQQAEKGSQQLATVVDTRDGTILYEDVCNLVDGN